MMNDLLSQLVESKNILEYSFFINPYISGKTDTSNDFRSVIDEVFAKINDPDCCGGLLGSSYGFFGISSKKGSSDKDMDLTLAFNPGYLGWTNILKQYCVFSTYVALREMFCGYHQRPSGYEIVHYAELGESDEHKPGMDYLIYNDLLEMSSDGQIKKTGKAKDSVASNYNNNIRSSIKTYEDLFTSYTNIPFEWTSDGVPYHLIDYFYLIRSEKKHYTDALSGYCDKKRWGYTNYKEGISFFKDKVNTNPLYLNSDRLYLHYLIEKHFEHNIISTLIKKTLDKGLPLNIENIHNYLAVMTIPDYFGRPLIAQYAFDAFDSPMLYPEKTFYSCLISDAIGNYLDRRSDYSRAKKVSKQWNLIYVNMMNYLGKIVFPVYSNCFFISITSEYKNDLGRLYINLIEYYKDDDSYNNTLMPHKGISNYNRSNPALFFDPDSENVKPETMRLFLQESNRLARQIIINTNRQSFKGRQIAPGPIGTINPPCFNFLTKDFLNGLSTPGPGHLSLKNDIRNMFVYLCTEDNDRSKLLNKTFFPGTD